MVVDRLRRCGYVGHGAVLALCCLLPGCPLSDDYYIGTGSTGRGMGGSVTAGGTMGTAGTLTPPEGTSTGGTYTTGGAVAAGGTYTTGGAMGTGGTLIPEGGMPAGGANTAGRQAGSSGFAGVAVELAQGKSAAASTEQTTRGNLAPLGNDGNRATRWSASGAETPNWWRVDLGQTYRLSRVEIDWEYARAYGYRIEVSDDNANYITVVDRSNSMDATRNQTTDVNASARYVQITVTTLPVYPITWASFWEVRVFGW